MGHSEYIPADQVAEIVEERDAALHDLERERASRSVIDMVLRDALQENERLREQVAALLNRPPA
jgi:hypothetical protein